MTSSTTDRIAVQSFCFRGFASNEEVAAKAREIGLAAVEPCGVHVDFADEAAQDAAIAAYRDAGVRLVSCGVNSIRGDGSGAECYFRFACKAGLPVISADVTPPASWDTFAAAERLAERYEVNVALHNHGGAHWLGNAQMLEEVFRRTGPRIGLMLDTAWAIDSREDPVKMVRRFGDRLMGVHLKDFVYSRDREPVDVVIGTGILDLPALVTALGEVGFDGVPIIEYEGDVNNPVPALTECVKEIAAAWNL
ncbi:MAG: sugar phosphate isomerase/epimerase [Spirochaetaceae bacterium]|nr:sugar phosphate isomerase/epimerase [Spirochaetaceae bacterium]